MLYVYLHFFPLVFQTDATLLLSICLSTEGPATALTA